MLQVLVRVEEELASVELDQDARHGPNVRLFIPSEVLKDHFRSPILASVDYESMALMLVRRPTKIDHFYLTVGRFGPLFSHLRSNYGALAREIA